MVAPLVAAAAVAGAASLVSAGMQWLSSRSAQNANTRERQRIEELLAQIQDPQFDRRNINPESVALLQQFVPEVAPYIKEVVPQQVLAQSQGAVEGRAAQMDSLGYMRRMMEQGYDPQTAIEMARAQRASGAEAASARQTAGAEAARRGFGGGLSMLSAGAGADAQDRLAQVQQMALGQAAQRRMGAAGQAASLGGQIRGEDISMERGNIDIINAYNQRLAETQQNWHNQGANTRNAANMRNISEAQRIDELNKGNTYNANVRNQQTQNTLNQQQFNNAMGKVTGQAAQANMAREDNLNRAAQTNQAWQGVADVASKGAGIYYQSQQQQADRNFEQEKLDRMYPKKG